MNATWKIQSSWAEGAVMIEGLIMKHQILEFERINWWMMKVIIFKEIIPKVTFPDVRKEIY